MRLRGDATNVLTEEECKHLISLSRVMSSHQWALDRKELSESKDIIGIYHTNDTTIEVRDFLRYVTNKVSNIVQQYLHEKIYVEFSNLVYRPPGSQHRMHVDNGFYDVNTKKVLKFDLNPETRHYSALLYLNSCEGGEFAFHNNATHEEEKVFSMEPGKLVFFSSAENLHSSRVTRSDRWCFTMFFTRDKNAEYVI